jgi:RimJ/RimL family protein N-acetyltransferase
VRLVDAVARWGATHGATRLQLLCDRENARALRFYAKAGFEETRLRCLRRRAR